MIKELNINEYKKLKDINFKFDNVNIISGANGTCKTSLLQIMSNSFKAPVKPNNKDLHSTECLDVLRHNNKIVNAKLENIVRDFGGTHEERKKIREAIKAEKMKNGETIEADLFHVIYANNGKVHFRHADVEKENRFRLTLPYKGNDFLFQSPTIYLGLSRLIPVGEVSDEEIKKGRWVNFPEAYLNEISELYKNLTRIEVKDMKTRSIANRKAGQEFTTNKKVVDSNTISAGEDNVYIILKALVSLKYYYDSFIDKKSASSILCIDEFDATLHPGLQVELFKLVVAFSQKYKIQVFLTTHSLYLIKHALENKKEVKVFYLTDEGEYVAKMSEVTIQKIEMRLNILSKADLLKGKKIPILMEDDQARLFLELIFDYYQTQLTDFSQIRKIFHFVGCKVGGEVLESIFSDKIYRDENPNSICILDGDKNANLTYRIISLPSKLSPEILTFKYAKCLYESKDSNFWSDKKNIDEGFTIDYYWHKIKSHIEIEELVAEVKDSTGTAKGVTRDIVKKEFDNKDRHLFYRNVLSYWIKTHEQEINEFMSNLHTMYLKTAPTIGLSSTLWSHK